MLMWISGLFLGSAIGSLVAKRWSILRTFEQVGSSINNRWESNPVSAGKISLVEEEIGVQKLIDNIENKHLPIKTPRERAMENRIKLLEGKK